MTLEASLGHQSCISRKDMAKKLARWGTIDGVLAQTGTGFSSQIGTKLRDWAIGQAWGSCYSWAALSSNDSKTLYFVVLPFEASMKLSGKINDHWLSDVGALYIIVESLFIC